MARRCEECAHNSEIKKESLQVGLQRLWMTVMQGNDRQRPLFAPWVLVAHFAAGTPLSALTPISD